LAGTTAHIMLFLMHRHLKIDNNGGKRKFELANVMVIEERTTHGIK
jgi:hypothetical protein